MAISIKDILTESFIEQFQESFAFSTGFGVVFVDVEGNHIGKGSNFAKFCQEINNTEEGAKYCACTNRKAIDLAIETRKPSIYVCHAGLVNIEIPLTFEGEYIGALTAGNVLCSDPDIYPRDPDSCGIEWLETEDAKDSFKNINVMTPRQIEATAISLENTVNYIIQTASFNKLQGDLEDEKNKNVEYEKKQIEMEHQLKLAELDALQKQVTPHFIFNVISSISRLISIEKYTQAKTILDSFSNMLRYSLSDINTSIILEQEISYIENYLKIQRYRLSDRLTYEIKVEDEAKNLLIPYFSLQPLVENAIEHGILPLENGGNLELKCARLNDGYIISISDDGMGISEEMLCELKELFSMKAKANNTSHVGISNCYKRLKLMYGDKIDLQIFSKLKEGTKIQITIAN